MKELMPCPFCGKEGTAQVETARSCEECRNFENEELCPAYDPYNYDPGTEDTCPYKAVVCCCHKGGCGASSGWHPSAEKAIEAWNTRRSTAPEEKEKPVDMRNISGMWCDDITFCPRPCDYTECLRNSKNIRDRTIPHSYFVEIPKDCPLSSENIRFRVVKVTDT